MSLLLLLVSMIAGDDWRFELSKPSSDYYVVFFTAKWCGPCQRFKASGLPALQAAFPVSVVDIDDEPQWKKQVDRYPTFWLCRKSDRVPIMRWTGAVTPEQVRKAIPAAPELSAAPQAASEAPEWHILPRSVVALSGPSSRWSGVVVGSDRILTCAHHSESSGIVADIDGRSIGCTVLKTDAKLDLCLLRLSEPVPAAFGAAMGSGSEPAFLAGYLRGRDPQLLTVQRRDGVARINGVKVLPLVSGTRPDSLSGMSGGPVFDGAGRVVGILRCADETTCDAPTIDSIQEFLR